MNFDEIVEKAPVTTLPTVEIDLSEFLKEPEKTTVITFQEPSTARIYQIGEDSRQIKMRAPEWPDTLCADVATLAISHLKPESKMPVALLYMKLAEEKRNVFAYLLARWREAFPHLSNFNQAVEEEKKTSRRPKKPS